MEPKYKETYMKEISSVLIAGAGSIGSMIAWQLFKKNPASVSILAGGERLERYRSYGFSVNDELCHFPLTYVESHSEPDLVIIACKAHHLQQVLVDLKSHIGSETLILSLLNGISSEKIIGDAYGQERIPYAMIIGTDAGHHGNATTFTKTGVIYFGDGEMQTPDGQSGRIQSIADFFYRMGISYQVPDNMLNRLWYKYMLNVGINQVTAILRRPYRILKKGTLVPEAAELLESAMREVMAVASAEGITLTDGDIEEIYRTIDTLADEGKTSMHQDVEAGRKTEVELFSGTMIELGKKHNIPVPVNRMFFKMLKAIESSY